MDSHPDYEFTDMGNSRPLHKIKMRTRFAGAHCLIFGSMLTNRRKLRALYWLL